MDSRKDYEDAETLSWRRLKPITDDDTCTDPSAECIEFVLGSTGESLRIRQDPQLAARLGTHNSVLGDPGCPTEADSATGATVWDTSVLVAKFLEEECADDEEAFESILELGSGTGLLGCVLQRLCPTSSIICTDREEILPLLRENLSNNCAASKDGNSSSAVNVMPYMWGDSVQPILDAFGRDYPTLILAIDCIYDEEAVPSLINTLRYLLLDSSGKALVAVDETIYPTPFRHFCKKLPSAGLSLSEINIEDLGGKESIKLYWIEPEDY